MSARAEHCAHWIPFLALACLHAAWIPAQAETIQLSIGGVPQAGGQLCWAAVSEMVINHMDSTTTAVSQGQLAAYNAAGTRTPEAIAAVIGDPAFMDILNTCTTDPASMCDASAELLLLGLTSSTSKKALKKSRLVGQIQANKPVPVAWQFAASTTSSNIPFKHQLIVVGVANGGDHILIWDPWPYDENTSSAAGSYYKWLTHEQYKSPSPAMGAEISHHSDIFDLKLVTSAPVDLNPGITPPTLPPTQPQPPPPPPPQVSQARLQTASPAPIARAATPAVPFADAIKSTAKLSVSARALKPKPKIEGRAPELGTRTADRPLPIVVLTPENLLAPRIELERLLQPLTRAVLYPVLADGRVVDSYLATVGPDGWAERGYASTEVTRRLVEQRRTLGGDPAAFYVVAIPAWATFFVARGVGDSTQLTPIATTRFSETGRTAPASTILPAIARDIRSSMDETERARHVRTPSNQPTLKEQL